MKKIFTRILIAVAVAIILSKLKLLGVINVSALEVNTVNPSSMYIQFNNNSQTINNMFQFTWNGSIFYGSQATSSAFVSHISYAYNIGSQFVDKTFSIQGTLYNSSVNYTIDPIKIYVRDSDRRISICNVNQSSGQAGVGSSFYTPDGFADFYCPNVYSGSQGISIFVVLNKLINVDDVNGMAQILVIENNSTENAIQDIKNNTKETNDFLKNDESIDSSSITNITNQDTNTSNTPVSDLIILPLNLLNAYKNGMNNSCSPVNLGSLLGTNISIPCINLQNYLGSDLWGTIDVLMSLFMAYNIGMLCITIWEGITSLHDDFYGAYQPQHGVGGRVQRGEMEGLY